MKKHILASLFEFAKAGILLLVIGLGAATLSAQSVWVPAPANPPANNASAPINVGNMPQRKFGPLFIGSIANPQPPFVALDVLGWASTTSLFSDYLVVSKGVTFAAGSPLKTLSFGALGLTLADGTQGAGKVLTSDASGRASWQTLSTSTGGSTGGTTPVGSCDSGPFGAPIVSGTQYQNISGTQLIVVARAGQSQTNGQQWLEGYIGSASANTLVSNDVFLSPNTASITFVVPPGYYYKVVNQSTYSPTLNAQAWKVCGGGSSGSSACLWKSTGSGMTAAQITADGATGVCRTTSGGSSLLGNVETRASQTNAVCFQAGDTNTLSTGSFEYYSCAASAGGGSTAGGSIANSGNLTIPNTDGTSVTWTHGLGEKPGFVRVVLVSLVNQSAAQGSYLAGEEVDVSNSVFVPSGGNYVSIPTLITPTQVILPHQWSSYPLHISSNRVGVYNFEIAIDRTTWAIKIYAGTSVGSSGGGTSAGTTVLPDFPDALACTGSLGTYVYTSRGKSTGGSVSYYYVDGTQYMTFGPSGSWTSSNMDSRYDASCRNRSISQLYASGEAFNFVGGGTSTGVIGSGMLGEVPDAILCQSPVDTSKVIMYSQGVNIVSWPSPGRLIYSSDSDNGPHLTIYFNPTTGAWINEVTGLSDSYTNAINGCRNKNISQQTGFKFAGVNTVTATTGSASLSDIRSALTYTASCINGEGRGQTTASCTAICATGKKVISGSCVAKTAAGTQSWVPYPINTSAPTTDGTGWACNGVSPAGNVAVQVAGSAICL